MVQQKLLLSMVLNCVSHLIVSHGGTGSVQCFLGGLANGMQRRGIAVNLVEVRQHGINGHLAHSGGCRVICVNMHSVYLHLVFT